MPARTTHGMGVVRSVPTTDPIERASTQAASAVIIVHTRPPSRYWSHVPEPSAAGCMKMLHCQSYLKLDLPEAETKRGTPQSPVSCALSYL